MALFRSRCERGRPETVARGPQCSGTVVLFLRGLDARVDRHFLVVIDRLPIGLLGGFFALLREQTLTTLTVIEDPLVRWRRARESFATAKEYSNQNTMLQIMKREQERDINQQLPQVLDSYLEPFRPQHRASLFSFPQELGGFAAFVFF